MKNNRFNLTISIYSLHPLKLLLISWVSWLMVFLLIPVSYINVDYNVGSVFTLILLLFSFILGVVFFDFLPKRKALSNVRINLNVYAYEKIFYFILLIGLLGVCIKFYEHFIMHEILSQPSLFEYKMSRMGNQFNSGLVGVVSALTYPFALVALMLNIKFKYFNRYYSEIFIWFLGCYWFFDAIFLSSMMAMVFLFSFVFITTVINKSIYYNKEIIVPITGVIFGGGVIVSYFIYLMYFRIQVDLIPIYLESREIIPYFYIDNFLVFSLINFLHYFAHGVVEWFRLFEHVGLNNYYLGMYEFYPIVKILNVLGFNIPTFYELASAGHKTGVYITFWGGFILDFGFFSFFVSFLLGVIAMSLYKGIFNGSFLSYLLYPVISTQIVFSSILNIFSGVVVYYLVSVLIAFGLLHLYKRKVS